MAQLLLELFSEEIPARMQGGAARDLERMAAERLKAAGLTYEALTTFAGPRRLTLVVEGLPAATPDREEEVKGPRANAPEQALEGFLRKTGLTRDQLAEREGVFFAVLRSEGQATTDLIPGMIDAIIRGFPWPKSMRWGDGTLRWVRPLKRILCLFDGQIVPFTVADGSPDLGGRVQGIETGDATEGHRFMGAGRPLKIRDFADYRRQLEADHVILDVADRKLRILEGARKVCADRGLVLVDDDGLLDEVAGLAEWPTPILGDMDPAFLGLPPEVVRLSMKTHQKYFAVRPPSNPAPQASVPPGGGHAASQSPPPGGSTREAGEGGLAPHFVVVANVEASDGGRALAAGNSRVLSARLDDARFFWDEDLKTGFDVWAKKLEGVTFHAKLGTLAERVERIAALAREIAPLVGADPDQAERAARLSKADLASAMVGEFPELQGVMGGYYARALASPLPLEGEGVGGWGEGASLQDMAHEASSPDRQSPSAPADRQPALTPSQPSPVEGEGYRDEIADAVRDHYKPQGPGDSVPTAPLTVAVALADKLDTLVGFFAIDEKPTGSKDPFALRRAALGLLRLIFASGARLNFMQIAMNACERIRSPAEIDPQDVANDLNYFISDRLKVLIRDEGKRHDIAASVIDYGVNDYVAARALVEALDAFLATDDGANLLAGYKRASNILRAEEKKGPVPTGMVETGLPGQPEQETALAFAAAAAATAVDAALETEDFAAAMTALARLRAPVDAFFDKVMVNSEVAEERENRLKLLGQVRAVMGRVADFGMIGG